MKRIKRIRRFLPLLIVILVMGGLLYRHVTRLPLIWPGQSVTLSMCDGENTTWKLVYTGKDIWKLHWALAHAKASPVQDWTPPEDPWPVYGICVNRSRTDFEAALCGGVWVDRYGRTLETDLDFSALWAEFDETEHTRKGIETISCRKELALRDGVWEQNFLVESSLDEPVSTVSMQFTGNDLDWSVTNLGVASLFHGNGASAALQVLVNGAWYNVPQNSWMHYGVTAEEYELKPGESYSSPFNLEPYGDLPCGNYRIVFGFDWDSYEKHGYSAVCFLILKDGTLAQEAPCIK